MKGGHLMKSKFILLLAAMTLILSIFTGCRDFGSNTQSAVSGVTSKVMSDTNNLGSQVSGVVSGIQSAVSQAG